MFSIITVSMGYFAYDFIDMSLYTWHKRSTKEMLLHHIVVFTCFGIGAHMKLYVPYAVISLIIEINSMCLHARAMLILTGKNFVYRYVLEFLLKSKYIRISQFSNHKSILIL